MAVFHRPLRFALLHPSVVLAYYAGMLSLVFLCVHPVFLMTITAGGFALAFFFAGVRQVVKRIRFIIPIALTVGLFNPLFVHRGSTILCYFLGNPITLEATLSGLYNAMVMLAVILLFVSFNYAVDQAAFLYLTARFIPRTAFVLDMALQSLNRYTRRVHELIQVQQTKGIVLTENSWSMRVRTALMLFKAFTVHSLEEGLETAVVLKARDYGVVRRTSYRFYAFSARDAIGLLVLAVLWGSILAGMVKGAAQYQFYPVLSSITLPTADKVVYSLCVVYVFLPILYGFAPVWENNRSCP